MKAKKILLMDRHEICNPKIVTTEMFNEAIAELEALQQPKSCDGCIRLPFILIELAKRDGGKCGTCKRFVKDHYELEPKEQ